MSEPTSPSPSRQDPADVPPGPSAETADAADFAGTPDCFDRLWTPHRMVYIGGENKPVTGEAGDCPFCTTPTRSDADGLVVARGETCFVVLNLYPYNPGHLLICPYRHVAGYPDLSGAERAELGELTAIAMVALELVSQPKGFNLGMNQGAVGGAGVAAHLHQHIVPRWMGDSNFLPIIGATKALPQLLGETRELLAHAWADASARTAERSTTVTR